MIGSAVVAGSGAIPALDRSAVRQSPPIFAHPPKAARTGPASSKNEIKIKRLDQFLTARHPGLILPKGSPCHKAPPQESQGPGREKKLLTFYR
jgi:hypothetical protein